MYHLKWSQNLGRIEQNAFPELLSDYKPTGRKSKYARVKMQRTALKLTIIILNFAGETGHAASDDDNNIGPR
jgi:hypothetical protein